MHHWNKLHLLEYYTFRQIDYDDSIPTLECVLKGQYNLLLVTNNKCSLVISVYFHSK